MMQLSQWGVSLKTFIRGEQLQQRLPVMATLMVWTKLQATP